MSMKLVCDAFNAEVGNAGRKLVLIKLADNANDKGLCWPSYQYVADQCEMGVRTVIRHIAVLVDMGLVSKSARINDNRQTSNVYHIHPDITRSTAAEVVAKPSIAEPTDTPDRGAKSTPGGVPDWHPGGVTVAPRGVPNWHTESPTLNHKGNHREPAKKAHQMPKDFELTDVRRQKLIDIAPHLAPENEWGHFVDHHLARGSIFKDWDRAWGTWVRRAAKFNPAPAQPAMKKRRKL